MNHRLRLSVWMLGLLLPVAAWAQEPAAPDPAAERMDALEQQLAAQNRRIEELEQEKAAAHERDRARTEEDARIATELAATKAALDVALVAAREPEPDRLSIYGFFDTTFYKAWYRSDRSVLITQNPPYSTFMMNNVNIYLKSQMTPTISALVEMGLSFAPLGYEKNLPIDAYVDGELNPDLVDASAYDRVDTTVPGGIASQTVRYGSVSIVRAHLDWVPRDWLGFRVGRWLTPYGIWNEEHAPTVLMGVYYPNLMNWDLVPASQMGAQIFGAIFPADMLQLKYAVTLSNGRGPMDTVMDFDENKAVGLRLQAIATFDKWKLTVGGYGYYGKYTDGYRTAEAYLNADLSRDMSNGSPIGGRVVFDEKYKEGIVAADLKLDIAGVQLFGEYVYRRVDYLRHPLMFSDYEFVQNGDFTGRLVPSHLSRSVYGIAAWTLPFQILDPVKVTPYAGFDWVTPIDSYEWFEQKTIRFGLNVQPSPFVVAKLEGIIDLFDERLGGRMNGLAAQVAVSF